MVITTPFQLMQWKFAVKMEAKGLRVTSGRKVTPHAAKAFGLRPRAKAELVLEHIEAAIAACKDANVNGLDTVELEGAW